MRVLRGKRTGVNVAVEVAVAAAQWQRWFGGKESLRLISRGPGAFIGPANYGPVIGEGFWADPAVW